MTKRKRFGELMDEMGLEKSSGRGEDNVVIATQLTLPKELAEEIARIISRDEIGFATIVKRALKYYIDSRNK